MTRHKHLKHLVRSRMEKTGERYAAARRHILAAATAAPNPPAGQHAWHLPGNLPATTAIRILLKAAGVTDPRTGTPLTEPMIFGLAGGIGIGVFSFLYEKEDFASLFLGGRHLWQDDDAYFRTAFARLGVAIELHEGSPRATDAALAGILASDRPAIAFVEAGLLPHRRMPPDLLGGGYHVVTVYELDEEVAVIGDLADEPVAIPREAFDAARSRIKRFRNRIVAVAAAPPSLDLHHAAADALSACVDGLDGAGAIGPSKRNFSLAALGDLAERLAGTGKQSWATMFPPGGRLWNVLTMLFDFVELRGGGGLARPLFAAYLAEAATMLPAGAPEISERYGELGQLWSDLAHAALPDAVPAFGEAKRQMTERAELQSGGDEAGDADARLAALKVEVSDCFPLTEAQCIALRHNLHEKVRELYLRETTLHQALRQLMRVHDAA